MKTKPSHRKMTLSGAFCLVALSGVAFALASGCGKSEAATNPGASAEHASVGAGAKVETDTYVVEMVEKGPYKAGAEGVLEVTLTAKGDYHINKQYPYKFKLAEPAPDGVTFPKPMLLRADGTFEEKTGTFKVPFTAQKAGKVKISGTFSLSVCSEANCMMDKQTVEREVDVK